MYFLIDGLEFGNACREAHDLVDQIVERARKSMQDSDDGMETQISLSRLMHDDTDISEVRDQFLGLLLAG